MGILLQHTQLVRTHPGLPGLVLQDAQSIPPAPIPILLIPLLFRKQGTPPPHQHPSPLHLFAVATRELKRALGSGQMLNVAPGGT